MPPPKSLSAYADIAAVFETIERADTFPARIEFPALPAAHRWRHRANAYRVRLRKQEEQTFGLAPNTGSSRYDDWEFRLVGTTVEVHKRRTDATLIIDGAPVQPKTHDQIEAEEDFQ